MNTITKSLLTGLAFGAAAYFIAGAASKEKRGYRYTIDYILQLEAKDSNAVKKGPAAFIETEAVIRSRLERSGNTYHNNKKGSLQVLDITVGNVTDTAGAKRLVSDEGLLKIWEVYQWADLGNFLTIADSVAGAILTPAQTAKTPKKQVRDESMAAEVRALLDSMESNPSSYDDGRVHLLDLINTSSGTAFVKITDTATLNKVLRADAITASLPADARFYYGLGVYSYGKDLLELYPINTRRSQFSIENKHIVSAHAGISEYTNRPVISFELSSSGARIWADLTEKNTGRPLAIVVDNHVISAPLVESRIDQGSSIISGDFTMEEAKTIADLIQFPALPAHVTLVKSQVTSQKSIGNTRHILLSLLAFAVAGTLSGFIFKALKST